MNRVYKVIWSKAKHCYVVTSEIAKSHTKGESTGRGLKKLAAALLVAAALMGPNFAWAAGDTVTVKDTTEAEQIVYTQKGADDQFATKTDLAAKANAADVENTYAKTADVANTYVNKTDAQVTNLTVYSDVEAYGNLQVGNGNFTVNGITGNVTTGYATIGDDLTVKGDTEMKGDLSVKGTLNAADGKFSVGNDGQLSVSSGKFIVDTNGGINIGHGTATIDNNGNITGKKLDVGDTTVKSLDAGNGLIQTTGTVKAGDVQTGTLKAGATTVASLDAGSGLIKTTGDISGTNITGDNVTVNKQLTTKDMEVKGEFKVSGEFKTDLITLGSKPNNYTEINTGNVTSEVNDAVSGVKYTAESIFNKDGSSITARTDEGIVDSTGKSIVGAKEISQYLGDNAKPDGSQKNVTRKMVRNNDGTFSMEDKAVVEGKSSTVSQNAEERKVTVTDGTKTLTVNKNLTDGIVSETNDGAGNTVTLTQGMNGTYTVETSGNSTEDIGGKKIENYKGLATNITGAETHYVSETMTTTVDGQATENFNKGLATNITGAETHYVSET
ncbi:ESPR domain-containing protein, partial [uncultured Dialister sp.]|uniref:ESPR domain-containing protein n=1 Tax=uncultured Dialister sp. TaxID=278064 RepID=UPI00265F38CA